MTYHGYALSVDLTGSREWPEAQQARLFGTWIGWTPDEICQRCAEHYGIPVDQVSGPVAMSKRRFDAEGWS